MIRWGSTQGRLVIPWNGELQCFPQFAWRQELHVARAIGLSYIEWLVERQMNPGNPVWDAAGRREMREAARAAGIELRTMMNDFVIDHSLTPGSEAEVLSVRLVALCADLGVRRLIIPLFEASDPSVVERHELIGSLQSIVDAASASGIEVCLETVLPAEALLQLLQEIGRPEVRVCFDTGNRAALGLPLADEIERLGRLITEVHIKDKAADGSNVLLGRGQVDFSVIASALARIAFDGDCTLETARGRDPRVTGAYHRALFHFYLSEAGLGAQGLHEECH